MPSQATDTATKSVMTRLAPLTNAQRLDVEQLVASGVPYAQARAIVQAYAPIRKAASAPTLTPEYLAAYQAAAKRLLPDWQHAMVHGQARARAFGIQSVKVRQSDDDKRRRTLQEIQSLKQRLRTLLQSIQKDGPLSSEVHVPGTEDNILGFRPPNKQVIAKLDVTALSAHELAYIKAAYNQQVPTESPVPDSQSVAPDVEAYMQSNRLVAGMDVELAAGAPDAEAARRRASRALLERPGFYDGVGTTPAVRSLRGLMIDVGCGANRQPGYLGLDLAPMDHGTVRHDVGRGIPFPDGSCRAIRLCNSLHDVIDMPGSDGDPVPLLTECQRLLMEGGRLYYTGPEPLYDPGQRWPLPGLVLAPTPDANPVGMHQLPGGQVSQELVRVPLRVPAYHGADAAYSPAGDLPVDLAMAMAAYNASQADTAMADMLNPGLKLPTLRTSGRTTPSLPQQLADKVNKAMGTKPVPILKAAEHKQIVYGVVLAPDEVDSQGDMMSAEDIETAAHAYLATSRVIGAEHGRPIEASVVESYVAPQQLQFAGQTEPVTQGSWVMGVRIHDAAEWAKALAGGYTGFSVGGFGTRDDL